VTVGVARERSVVGSRSNGRHFAANAWLVRHVILVALVIECIVFSVRATNFLEISNFKLVLTQVASIGIIAVPETLLVLSGFIDFAVGSLASLVAVTVGLLLQSHGVWFAGGMGLATGAIIGALQGVLIMVFKFPTMVVTLGFYGALGGVALVVANGQIPDGFSNTFALLGQGQVNGIDVPVPIVICVVAFVLGALFLYRTRWGRHVIAIGSNRPAAYRVGIRVKTIVVGLYVLSGLAAALSSMILASELSSAPPILGQGLELNVISAVLLGGVAFTGGSGSMLGVVAAVLFIGVLNNGLLLLGVAPYWSQVSSGVALVLAAAMNALTQRRGRARRAR